MEANYEAEITLKLFLKVENSIISLSSFVS